MASIEVVTWVSTQLCVGISKRRMMSSSMASRSRMVADVVARRVDADDGVAAAVHQPVDDGRRDAAPCRRSGGSAAGAPPCGP